MKTRQLKPFIVSEEYPAPINPFHQDFVHTGSIIGKNIAVMAGNADDNGNCRYIVVIDLLTGERKMIEFLPYPIKLTFRECLRYWFSFGKGCSTLREKIIWHIRTKWNYRPWLKYIWTY